MIKTVEFIKPNHSDQHEFWNSYMKAQIKEVITVHNHIYKFQGFKPTKKLLLEAIDTKNLQISIITESDGTWYFMGTDSELAKLPKIIPIFKRLYRFQKAEK